MGALLEVRGLKTFFITRHGVVHAVDGISYSVDRGRTIGIVGESGCGKSVSALSIVGLVPTPPGRIVEGAIMFEGRDLTRLSEREMQQVRGREISMIFQDPMTSLNPVLTVRNQLTEGLRFHFGLDSAAADERALELLCDVGIPDPEQRLSEYPHQLSGGMRQRVMIAIALACRPKIVIADEPTTALDVTIQAQILELLGQIQKDSDMALILITHDLGVVAGVTDEVIVMYAGKIVEQAPTRELFKHPRHPYTAALLASVPRLDQTEMEFLESIPGAPPDLVDPAPGCRFRERCRYADECPMEEPDLQECGADHLVACWRGRG
ncbi:MAG: Oligopeptide transport ATP-binding protein OppD [Actinobacteria bacterium ADurb.Bin444]|nr:MAG: Oligopeptide transport ATP-binding protein OppD [Actinobacteria bacterium ADurb.Bin444]